MTASQLLGWGLGAGALLLILWLIKSILVPFLISFLLAYAFDPLVSRMARWIPRPPAILLLFLVILLIATLVLLYVIPVVQDQISQAIERLPVYLDLFRQEVLPRIERRFGVHIPQTLDEALEALLPKMKEAMGLFQPLTYLVVRVFSNTLVLIIWLANLLVIPFATYYFLKDFERIKSGVVSLVPTRHKGRIDAVLDEVDHALSGFIRGQLLNVLILMVLYSAVLLIIGVDLSIVLGIVAGFMELVPYAGFIVGAGFSLLITTLQFRDLIHPVYVLAAFSAIQLVQGFILSPKIIGHHAGLHPLFVIAALYVGGDLFGFVGVLLAVPAATVLLVILKVSARAWRASAIYGAPPLGE
jgi:predicted PurR-regulated permease PerM